MLFNMWCNMWCNMWSISKNRVLGMFGMLAGVAVAFTSVFSVNVGAQTLFVNPDTTPNYASYQYLEECENAALRLSDELETRKSLVWYDTMSIAMQNDEINKRATNPRLDTSIHVASMCLKTFKPDTVHIRGIGYAAYILQVLLIANRDQEAQQFAQHVLDSVRRQPEWDIRDARSMLVEVFGGARPVRLDAAKRYYAEQLEGLKGAVARHLDRFAFREAPLSFDWRPA